MKKLMVSVMLLFSSLAFAAGTQINSAQFNPNTGKVEMSVSYGGGCSQHFFKLEMMGGCFETYPVQCTLKLVHTMDKFDMCEAYITQDLELDLPEGILGDSYYSGAMMSVSGGEEGGVATFQLP